MPDQYVELVLANYNRTRRRALKAMARACGIEPERFPNTPKGNTALWQKVTEAMEGGVSHPSEPIDGDPFALFVTGICPREHDGRGPVHQTAVWKQGGTPIDQADGEKAAEHLKAEENLNRCQDCGESIDIWQTDMTRVSTFAARDKKARMIGR